MTKRKRKVKLTKIEVWERHLLQWQEKLDKANKLIARAVPQISYAKKRIEQLRKINRVERMLDGPLVVEPTQAEKVKVSNATVQHGSHIDSMPTQRAPDEDIPTFLDRTLDPKERKREKSRVRIEKLKAKQRGDTKRMPLSGREALAAIRESS